MLASHPTITDTVFSLRLVNQRLVNVPAFSPGRKLVESPYIKMVLKNAFLSSPAMTLARSRKAEETGCTIVVMLSHQVFLLDCFLIWFGRLWYLKQYQNGGALSKRSKLHIFVLSGPLEPHRSIFWNISSQGVGRCCFLFFGWQLHLSSNGRSITGKEQVLPYYVPSELDKDVQCSYDIASLARASAAHESQTA